MKKIMMTVLIMTMLMSIGVTTYAREYNDTKPTLGTRVERDNQDERPSLMELYYPEGVATLEALKAEHQAFHDARATLRADMKAIFEAEKEALKASVESGEITLEEAREIIAEKKATFQLFKADMEVIKNDKQAEAETIKAKREALKESIKTLLSEEEIDADAVAKILAEGIDLLAEHIAMDYKYADMVDALLESYGY